jgi:hypothetical protein
LTMRIAHEVQSRRGETPAKLSSPITAEFILQRCDRAMLAELYSRRDEMASRPDLLEALDRAIARLDLP